MSRTPKHVEIERHLRAVIEDAQPGDRLPSDTDLCDRFGVSRMTARQAVRTLQGEGLLVRRRGQGTFATEPPRVHRQMGTLLGFSEEMHRRGLRPGARVLATGVREATRTEAAALSIPRPSRVGFVERLRLADDIPVAIELAVLPPGLRGVIDADLATGSIFSALRELGWAPAVATGTLTARLTTDEEAELLGLPTLAVLMVERRTIFNADGVPVERSETRYAADRYVFDVRLDQDLGG